MVAAVVTTSWLLLLLLLVDETGAGRTIYLACASGVEIGVASDYLVVVGRTDKLRPKPGDHI